MKKVTAPSNVAVVTLPSGRPQTDAKEPYCSLFLATSAVYWSSGQLWPGPERQDGTAMDVSLTAGIVYADRWMQRDKLTIDSVIQADTDVNRVLAAGCAVETLEGDSPPHRVYRSADVDLPATVRVEFSKGKASIPFSYPFYLRQGVPARRRRL